MSDGNLPTPALDLLVLVLALCVCTLVVMDGLPDAPNHRGLVVRRAMIGAVRATYSIVVKPKNRGRFVRMVDADSEAAAREQITRVWGEDSIESICPLPPTKRR